MAAPSLTYTLTNGTTADAAQVMQNFNDLLNGITDGTKDLSLSALTLAGTLTANGHANLGNSSADDLTITASLASSIPVKTTASYNVGDSTHGLASIYFGANSQTVRILPSASMSATWTLTLPVTAGTNNYIMTTNGSGVSAWTSWTNSAWYADGSNAGTLSATTQTIGGAKTLTGLTTALSLAVTGGSSANYTVWQGTNTLNMRGGTSGVLVRSTGDADIAAINDVGQITAGIQSGTTQTSHLLHGYSNLITYGNGIFNLNNRQGSAASIVFGVSGSKVGNIASSSTYPFGAANSSGSDVVVVHTNGIYNYDSGAAVRAVGVTSGNVLEDSTVSRRELKKDFSALDVSGLWSLPTYNFRWKKTDEEDIGCIADEVAKLLPAFAHYSKDGDPEGVNYTKLAVACIAALQLLKAEVEALKAA